MKFSFGRGNRKSTRGGLYSIGSFIDESATVKIEPLTKSDSAQTIEPLTKSDSAHEPKVEAKDETRLLC